MVQNVLMVRIVLMGLFRLLLYESSLWYYTSIPDHKWSGMPIGRSVNRVPYDTIFGIGTCTDTKYCMAGAGCALEILKTISWRSLDVNLSASHRSPGVVSALPARRRVIGVVLVQL